MSVSFNSDHLDRFGHVDADLAEELRLMVEAGQIERRAAAPTAAGYLARLLASVRAATTQH